jgi:hypothetical protein
MCPEREEIYDLRHALLSMGYLLACTLLLAVCL